MPKVRKWAQSFWRKSTTSWSQCRHFGFKVLLWPQSVSDSWLKINRSEMEHEKGLNCFTAHKRPYSVEVWILHNNPRRAHLADVPSLLSLLPSREKGTSFAAASVGTCGTNSEASFDHVGAQENCFNHPLLKRKMGHTQQDMVLYQTGDVNAPETRSFGFPFL